MGPKLFNVLFLCTGNSARSIMAECALRRWGRDGFRAFSAGSAPRDEVHPVTLALLEQLNYPTGNLRSKSWDEFARPDSPVMDFVFTVCDQTANETCPVWPGQPTSAHWGIEDPVVFDGPADQKLRYFMKIYTFLESRIKIFVNLPITSLSQLSLQTRLDEIGRIRADGDDPAYITGSNRPAGRRPSSAA